MKLTKRLNFIVTKFRADPQTIFLLLAGIFGLLFMFITPPMQSPDEVEHLYRAYQVSQFNIKADPVGKGYGGTLPVTIVDSATILKNSVAGQPHKVFDTKLLGFVSRTPLSPRYQEEIRFDNTAIYSPVPYLPQAFGIGVARLLHLNPLLVIYFGRLANLVAFIALLYVAIRMTPIGKWAFVAIALNPVSLFLASTLSSDAMAIGLISLFIAIVLKLRTCTKQLSYKYVAALSILVVMICLTKNIYIPLVLLLILVPRNVLAVYKVAAMMGGAILVGLLWNVMILPIAQNIPSYFAIPGTINTSAQISYVLHHPFGFLRIMANNLVGQQSSIAAPSYDGVFGWLDTPNPYWVDLIYMLILVVAAFYREESKKILESITKNVRLLFLLLALGSSIALYVTLYVGYSTVGSVVVQGVQGRYFIPLTFLLVPVLATGLVTLHAPRKLFIRFTSVGLAGCLVMTTLTLIARYYSL